jgi:NIMA (never in mitosis gene a)-related kinase
MSEKEQKDCKKEAKVLEVLNHPNIIKFRDVYTTHKGKLCIVMNYADGGDLEKLIRRQQKLSEKRGEIQFLSEDEVLTIFTQICLAIKHVHDRKIIHRDLKAENIFLTKNRIVKLGDLGVSRVMNSTVSKAQTVVGTPYYMSPECIQGQPYDRKSDIWSLGILLYQLCSLKIPFPGNSLVAITQRIMRLNYEPIDTEVYSKNVVNLIESMIQKDPEQRPSINSLLKYPLIWEKVGGLLSDQVYKDEFSHATLHGQNVFKMAKEKIKNK